jgi:C4-dicarboxylate-specific signal transduction histidine kinase
MEQRPDPLAEAGLQFFGKISASISHEINNALAILNENAGLLDDLCVMAEKGKPPTPERLKKVAQNQLKQVRRANDIVKRMNRFSHSVDEPVAKTDIGELMGLVVSLSNRFIANKNVTVAYAPPEPPVTVVTNPFFLENLLFNCLMQALASAGSGKAVSVAVTASADGPAVVLSGLEELGNGGGGFPGEQDARLMALLKTHVHVEPADGSITVTFHG